MRKSLQSDLEIFNMGKNFLGRLISFTAAVNLHTFPLSVKANRGNILVQDEIISKYISKNELLTKPQQQHYLAVWELIMYLDKDQSLRDVTEQKLLENLALLFILNRNSSIEVPTMKTKIEALVDNHRVKGNVLNMAAFSGDIEKLVKNPNEFDKKTKSQTKKGSTSSANP